MRKTTPVKHEEMCRQLIEGTIRVIARHGLDKATTKQISKETGLNEAYIYRCFEDKEDLYTRAFMTLDRELAEVLMKQSEILYNRELSKEERTRIYFMGAWKFMLRDEDRCRTFFQYYYSPYFTRYAMEDHKALYAPILERISAGFREEANVPMLFHHMMSTMLNFVLNIFNKLVPNDEDTAEHVFRLAYFSTQPYFNEEW